MLAARRFVPFLVIAALLLVGNANSYAQPVLISPALTASPVEPGVAAVIADKRTKNAEQLRVAMRKLETNGASDSAAALDVAFYQTRDAVLAQQEAVEQQIKDLEARKVELDKQLKTPPAEDKPCTFVQLDQLKDELASEQARANLIGDKLTAAKAGVTKAQAALDESKVKRHQAETAYEAGKESVNVAELAMAADRARQEATLAAESLELRKREVAREQLAQEVQRLAVRVCQNEVTRMSPRVTFSKADYQAQLDDIKKKEESAAKALFRAQSEFSSIDFQIRTTQHQLDTTTGDRTTLTEKREAQRRSLERCADEIDAQSQRLQQLTKLRSAWSWRYQLASASRDDVDSEVWGQLKSQQKETKDVLEDLAKSLRAQIGRMREVRSKLTSVTKRLDAAANGPADVVSCMTVQKVQLEDTLKVYERNLVAIETSRRVHEKLLDEIGLGVEAFTPKAIAFGAWYQAKAVWEKEVLAINGEPITIGMGTKCVTILALGWMFARFSSTTVANRLLKRFRLSKDATSAIRSLVFYSMLVFVGLSALKSINVDLTAFTILGGALAIGVGFGSQALINNFIGGLIMLAERPVRLGERITFNDLDGVVEDVGFRCTKLRTQADHLVTIPNSTLVNESIENIDRRRTIRRVINIAVTYNITRSLLAEAVQAIRDILEEKDIRERIHPIVGFEEFSPQVFFTDFCTESLSIQVTYWYAPVASRAYSEHSERVNFRIMEEFDRLGVEFAFPSKTAYVKNPKKADTRPQTPDSYAA